MAGFFLEYFDNQKAQQAPPNRAALDDGMPLDPAGASRYARAALDRECANVRLAPEGQRNDTLNRAAFNVSQLVAVGALNGDHATDQLTAAAQAAGLDPIEIHKTIGSGMRSGSSHPRNIPPPQHRDPVDVHALTGGGQTRGAPLRVVEDGDPATEDEVATWAPAPLDDILDGTYEPELPTVMARDDGMALLYRGRIHSLHGESESGKSLLMQAEAARLIADEPVLYVDFESDRAAVVGRLLELGANKADVAARFTYVRPEVDPRRFEHERAAVAQLLGNRYALAVIDGVTESLGIFGYSSKDNDEVTTWLRVLPRRVASATGAAVVVIDHVTKDADTRGRFAIGGQAKMAGLDGAAYVVAMTDALGRGRRGELELRVAKDRPGGVRSHAGAFRRRDNTQLAATATVDSTVPDGRIRVTLHKPDDADQDAGAAHDWRPTRMMEQISMFLEAHRDQTFTGRQLRSHMPGRAATVDDAVEHLRLQAYVRVDEGGPGRATHVSLIRPYRAAEQT